MAQVREAGVVTPEAVRLEFEDASVGSRGVAIVLDWAVQFATLLVAGFAGGLLFQRVGPGLPPWVGITLVTLLSFMVLFGYPVAFETLARGRTPGKMAMGLRVLTVEGAPVAFRHAAIRAALGLVDFLVTSGFVAVITALLSSRSQRLGDHVAGTVVVRERTGAGKATAASFAVPEGYERYAASIDPAGLRVEDYQAVRAFLLRAPDLPPDRRAPLARRLADGVAARVAHRIPPDVHPETFLRCVAARHQARGAAPVAGPSFSSAGSHDSARSREPASGQVPPSGPGAGEEDAAEGRERAPADPDRRGGGFAAPG